jgi:hypothetical protein
LTSSCFEDLHVFADILQSLMSQFADHDTVHFGNLALLVFLTTAFKFKTISQQSEYQITSHNLDSIHMRMREIIEYAPFTIQYQLHQWQGGALKTTLMKIEA